MPLVPDDKDWTWVLKRKCDECSFDASDVTAAEVAPMLRDTLATWHALLRTREDVHERPHPDLWSPLEYGCHVRDVCRVYTGRVNRMLTETAPHYANWDQDETAIASAYDQQDPRVVADAVVSDGTVLAELFESVDDSGWRRTGLRSDGAAFTVDSISRYFIHDIVHHLHDVGVAS